MYCVVAAGQDQVVWLNKYLVHFELGHVKDKRGNQTGTFGTGTINYPAIVQVAKKAGM
jgi:sugar phosphate isomerase/epimerase